MRVPEGPQPSEGGGFPGGAGVAVALPISTVPYHRREAAGSPGAQDRDSLSVKLRPELPGGCFP